MNVFVFSDDLSGQGPVWLNLLSPMFQVYASNFQTTYIALPPERSQGMNRQVKRIDRIAHIRETRKAICDKVERNLSQDGCNVLIVWTSTSRNVFWTKALDRVWGKFSHRVLHVCDTMQPDHVPLKLLSRFDLITCFCADLTEKFNDLANCQAIFWPAHLDTLHYHSVSTYRPLDMIVVGRRNRAQHKLLHHHYNQLDQKRIYLDFVTRTQADADSCKDQFRILMTTYAKSKIAFCYEPSNVARYRNRSPMLSRWVHGWAAGCTVMGKMPTGKGTRKLMDWPEAVIDLPNDEHNAIDVVEDILNDATGMEERSIRNVLEAIDRHDTRYRIKSTLDVLGLEVPISMKRELEKLSELKDGIAREHGISVSSNVGDVE